MRGHDVTGILEVESRGTTGYHVGEMVDPRMRETAARRGIELTNWAQQVAVSDLEYYDLVLAMDLDNLRDLQRLARKSGHEGKIRMFREFDPETDTSDGALDGDIEVPDPWYGGRRGFEVVFEIVYRTCLSIVEGQRARLQAEPRD